MKKALATIEKANAAFAKLADPQKYLALKVNMDKLKTVAAKLKA
jgi:hypothetical protein